MCSLDEAKRNPGFFNVAMEPRITLRFIQATKLTKFSLRSLRLCGNKFFLFVLQRHFAEHDHGLGPVGRSQFAEYGRDVRLDRCLGHAEFITNLLV